MIIRKYNQEVSRKASRKWRAKNVERNRAYCKQWKEENPEARKIHDKQYKETHPEKKKVDRHARRTREKNAEGSFTLEEWEQLKMQFGYKCAYCGKTKELTVDHKIPLARGGTNYISNIQPLCMLCNQKKGTSILASGDVS